ncbi:Hypothetical protein J6898_02616 [Nakaseomyces glabratus]
MDVRKQLYLQCLNREFAQVLAKVRGMSTESLDYNFLQMYLGRSCQWAHVPSIDYLWMRFVMKEPLLLVRPQVLCGMATIALNNDKGFLPSQLLKHYTMNYLNKRHISYDDPVLYHLNRVKVESFAKGTKDRTTFMEKWKVFLQDIDDKFPTSYKFRIRDYMNLSQASRTATQERLGSMLFDQDQITIKNPTSMSLLLNIILLHKGISTDYKLAIFEQFLRSSNGAALIDDSIQILLRLVDGNSSQLRNLLETLKSVDVKISATTCNKIDSCKDKLQ